MTTRLPGTDEAKLVRTPALSRIEAAAALVVPHHEILVVHGEHGTGKNTAVDTYLAGQPHPVIDLELQPRQSSKDIVRWLHDRVVAADVLPERDLQDDLVEALAAEQRIVVVRHAHRLSAEAAGQLQWLHARPGHAWSLFLIGGPRTGAAISRDPLLRGAVTATVEVKPLKGDELLGVLQSMHPLFLGAGVELLTEIDSRVCHGLLRNWARFLQHAIHLRDLVTAHGSDAPVLDRRFAKAVVQSLPTTTHKAH